MPNTDENTLKTSDKEMFLRIFTLRLEYEARMLKLKRVINH